MDAGILSKRWPSTWCLRQDGFGNLTVCQNLHFSLKKTRLYIYRKRMNPGFLSDYPVIWEQPTILCPGFLQWIQGQTVVCGSCILEELTQKMKIFHETYWALTDLIPNVMSYHREAVWWLCSIQNVLIKKKVFLGLTLFSLFLLPVKLLEEAVEEAVAEAEVVEEEEEAQDDNFSSYSGQLLGNFRQLPYSRQFQVYFVQVLFMVSIFNKRKCEKVSFLC